MEVTLELLPLNTLIPLSAENYEHAACLTEETRTSCLGFPDTLLARWAHEHYPAMCSSGDA